MNPTVTEINGLTGETITREATPEELAEMAEIAVNYVPLVFEGLQDIP